MLSTPTAISAPQTPAPGLLVTPSAATLLVGEPAAFSAVDDSGRPLIDVHWSLDPPLAELHVENGEITLGPKQPGHYVLTATAANQSATATIAIVADAKLPAGTLSPSGKQVFAVYGTDLRSFDSATGALTAELRLPDHYSEIAGRSPSGGYLVLAGSENGATRFASVSSRLEGAVRSVVLTSNFSSDALSEDGRWLYLIEHASALDYRVRRYDLDQGRMDPNILVEKGASATELMNGERYASVAVNSTVYIRSCSNQSIALFGSNFRAPARGLPSGPSTVPVNIQRGSSVTLRSVLPCTTGQSSVRTRSSTARGCGPHSHRSPATPKASKGPCASMSTSTASSAVRFPCRSDSTARRIASPLRQ